MYSKRAMDAALTTKSNPDSYQAYLPYRMPDYMCKKHMEIYYGKIEEFIKLPDRGFDAEAINTPLIEDIKTNLSRRSSVPRKHIKDVIRSSKFVLTANLCNKLFNMRIDTELLARDTSTLFNGLFYSSSQASLINSIKEKLASSSEKNLKFCQTVIKHILGKHGENDLLSACFRENRSTGRTAPPTTLLAFEKLEMIIDDVVAAKSARNTFKAQLPS